MERENYSNSVEPSLAVFIILLVGDNGQGDALAAQQMLEEGYATDATNSRTISRHIL